MLELNERVKNWLLDSEPWIEYRTRLDLLDQGKDDQALSKAYRELLAHPPIRDLISELYKWPGPVLKSHKKSGHFLHKLSFLAEIGVMPDNPGVQMIVQRIRDHRSSEGLYQVLANIHPRYGGSGEDELAWMLCDAPLVVHAMVRFGMGEDEDVQESLNYLLSLQKENGWPCAVSPKMGGFRGPGRKTDSCPYANLVMLKLLAQFPERLAGEHARVGVESILSLWEHRKEKRPYLFAMGTDFLKLKAPLVWFDLLHVSDVLTRFPWAQGDHRLQEMLAILKNKTDQDGMFTPESIWMDWKGWEFGQKKEPSKWVTLLALRVLKRAARSGSYSMN